MKRFKILSTDKVSLVAPAKEDIEAWYKGVNDIETQSYLGSMYGVVLTLEDEQDYYESLRANKKWRTFSIFVNNTEKIIWNVSLMWIDFQNRKAEMWIAILDPETRGKWYGTDSVKLILDFAFNVLSLNKVNLRVIDFNERAKTVYEKIWFKECGRLKEEEYRNGKAYDTIFMEIFWRDYWR